MKEQLNTLLETARNAGAAIKEKAVGVGQSAVDSTVEAIERWLEEFPRIESYGLKISSFSFIMRLSPSLDVELRGKHAAFTRERLDEILAENKSTSLTGMVFAAIRTAYRLHGKIASKPQDPIIVKIRLSLSPEISVFIGELVAY
jgi:hypothetical protein